MIVTVTPTIMSGTVVRWHLSVLAAEAREPLVSASQLGVRVHGYLHAVPAEVMAAATSAHEALSHAGGCRMDVDHLATHRRGASGQLEPIERVTQDG